MLCKAIGSVSKSLRSVLRRLGGGFVLVKIVISLHTSFRNHWCCLILYSKINVSMYLLIEQSVAMSGNRVEMFWKRLGASWRRLRGVLVASWGDSEPSWTVLQASSHLLKQRSPNIHIPNVTFVVNNLAKHVRAACWKLSWSVLRPSWSVLAPCWNALQGHWKRLQRS